MKTILKKTLGLLAISTAILSFTPTTSPTGGEGFEIYVNGKVMIQRFGKEIDAVKTLKFEKASPNDKITIRYFHCGKIGKNRILTIKDGEDKLIKTWEFKDGESSSNEMSCQVSDLVSLKKGNNNVFKLYYSSSELPKARLLTSVVFEKSLMAAR